MAITITHEIGSHSALLADVRIPSYAAWGVHIKYAKNNSGTLTLSVCGDNPELPLINSMVSEVAVMDGAAEIWRGRVAALDKTDRGRYKITVMGLLDYLHDTLCPAIEASGTASKMLTKLITAHNAKPIAAQQKYAVGSVTISDTVALKTQGRSSTWTELAALIQKYGGYVFARRANGANYIDWLASVDHVCGRTLESGVSISSLSLGIDPTDLVTVMYGYGGTVDGATIDVGAANGGAAYVTAPDAVGAFGWIEGVYQDTSLTDASALLAATKRELQRKIDAVRSVKVTALDRLDLQGSESMDIGYQIRVRAPRLGIDELMPIVELDWYPYEPTKTSIVCCASMRAISRIK